VLAETGVIGFGLYLWLLGAAAWGLVLVTRMDRTFGVGLAAVLLVLFVHSLLYAGFFEDPLTWGVFGLTAAALAASPARAALGTPAPTVTITDRSEAADTLDRAGATRFLSMPRAVRWIVAAVAVLVLVLAGVLAALLITTRDRSQGSLETDTGSISVASDERPDPAPPPRPESTVDKLCWPAFGGSPLRSLSRPDLDLTLPPKKPTWTRALNDLMEYPPTYCNGELYVNLEHGKTVALDADTGKVLWIRRSPGLTVSSPAIAGDRLIVSSHGGTVTAFRRADGARLWQLRADAAFESSPVAVDGLVFVGGDDGRLYALDVETGEPQWIYNLGGRISSSPSVVGGNVCITTYSGAVGCVGSATGERSWVRYFKRDAFRYESFYASPSSDGERLYTVSRAGRVLALDAATGDDVWQASTGSLTYGTPAIANGRVFVGDLGRTFQAFRASDGQELWEIDVPGRVLGPPLVVGNYVFFSTLEQDTLAAHVETGEIGWRIGIGKYAPGIATERRYYFSLNGRLVTWDAARRG
jgi:outer membrane protein assembly factor BamB